MTTLANIFVSMVNILRPRVEIFLVAVTLLVSSCAQPPQPAPPDPIAPPQSTGEIRFLTGDFTNALLEYEHDYETALVPEDRRPALYGLACTQLILAQSDTQVAEALSNLEKWQSEKLNSPGSENHHLLIAAVKVQIERMQKKHLEQAHLTKQKNSVIANQRKKILQMGATVDNLQKQLEELEVIDETLQEKKKPL